MGMGQFGSVVLGFGGASEASAPPTRSCDRNKESKTHVRVSVLLKTRAPLLERVWRLAATSLSFPFNLLI